VGETDAHLTPRPRPTWGTFRLHPVANSTDGHLFIVAFDHRGSYESGLYGIHGEPTAADLARLTQGKQVIFEGFRAALRGGAPAGAAGVLVDEELGADIARAAKSEGTILAMPAEESGKDEFHLQYGDDFGFHIEAFDPDFVKVLVRYNPAGDRELNTRQAARLKALGDWLKAHDRRFLFELLVPPTTEELEEAGSTDSYDHSLRPGLVARAIAELQEAGVEPDVWKIEGLDTEDDCIHVARQARRGGRDHVRCIVLGRGADEERVHRWLRVGARADGFTGFAIGRTIWWDPLKSMLAEEIDRAAAVSEIAARYLRAIDVYLEAAA
jgi:myo-inositol catabolism protein IolC